MLDKRFLETLFNEDEQVCVTDHKAAYRSIPLSDLRNKLVDLTKNDGSDFKLVPVESLKLISINPIKGPRNDESCTAYRNFLIEMDDSALAQQWSYIQELNLPSSKMKRGRVAKARAISTRRRSPPERLMAELLRKWLICKSSSNSANSC